ncbi:hypothetical protein [Bythopirellula goksoeyrii]|uniref:Uncharacterized protein n=1 Tax=Bythopirellula goksoeyrii TaxID=1400387 RepID=A0A5B9QLX2_9BACT|nr:hypothetical protein [Bythopirellula goksoeyrii]QEG37996.1 hypothetical protein Pr1d_53440 [Bythopirellula goksoeyrii]
MRELRAISNPKDALGRTPATLHRLARFEDKSIAQSQENLTSEFNAIDTDATGETFVFDRN